MAFGHLLRRTAVYGGLLGGFLAADAAGMVRAAGADVWNVAALENQMAKDREFRELLDVKEDEILHRLAVKEELVNDLLAGRRALPDVTDDFLRLHADAPEVTHSIRAQYRGADEREATARNVLNYSGVCGGPVEVRPAAAARLKAEFAAAFGRPVD